MHRLSSGFPIKVTLSLGPSGDRPEDCIRSCGLLLCSNMADSQEEVYVKFLNYDWASHKEFQDGLSEIMEGHLESLKELDPSVTSIPPAQKQQLIDQAKSFFFCSSTGHILNLDDFYVWKRNNGGKITLLDDTPTIAIAETTPSTVELKETPQDSSTEPKDASEPSETPYSSNYQQLVELIVSGQPVPGIKQIPDTVLADQKSESSARSRTKPWEKVEKTDADINELTS